METLSQVDPRTGKVEEEALAHEGSKVGEPRHGPYRLHMLRLHRFHFLCLSTLSAYNIDDKPFISKIGKNEMLSQVGGFMMQKKNL